MAASDTDKPDGAFKSLTDASDWIEGKIANWGIFTHTEKPVETTNQSSKSMAIGAGFKGFIGTNSTVNDAFQLYAAGPFGNMTVGLLSIFPTTSKICTVSANLNKSFNWGKASAGVTGLSVKYTITDTAAAGTSTEVIAIRTAIVAARQKAGAIATKIPGIDIAG